MLDTVRDQHQKAAADPSTHPLAIESFEILERTLRKQVNNTHAQAVDLVRSSPNLRETFSLLVTIPGIGEKTAVTLIGEFGPRIQTATPRQMTSFAGLDPVLWESGSSVRRKPRISKQGNHRIRRALYMAAVVASWANPILRTFYQRLLKRGIAKKAAITAVMRKLLHIASGVIKHRQPFNPNLAHNHTQ
jgi:transposase